MVQTRGASNSGITAVAPSRVLGRSPPIATTVVTRADGEQIEGRRCGTSALRSTTLLPQPNGSTMALMVEIERKRLIAVLKNGCSARIVAATVLELCLSSKERYASRQ